MNLCLTPIATTTFLREEARYGRSRLQNYEAIIRKSTWESNASWYWKTCTGVSTSFPICLGILYKLFIGGQSFTPITLGDPLYNDAWGLYSPPGLTTLGIAAGLFPLFNATVPFFDATTNSSIHIDLGSQVPAPGTAIDPPFPRQFPQVYGFNIVMLQADRVAFLDAPTPDWVIRVQQELAPNDSWTVSANVLGTVTQVNNSIEEHRGVKLNEEDSFWDYYTNSDFNDYYISPFPKTPTSPVHCVNLYSGGDAIAFLTNDKRPPGHHDQTWFFMGITNCNDINSTFSDAATMLSTSRRNCWGE
ncbi:hypothetical protein SUNI508_05831 [Seiridium unicorne]|uniref:Uncharacterized protein n=1 Tax=Seiridium unicorne TaxID=138068 RepID=A0ABR2V301_9PEZI